MKKLLLLISLCAGLRLMAADDLGQLIFQDDFNRNESQEQTDEPGNGWSTNSKARAKGHKQVDLRDGAMYVYIHPEADHPVTVQHAAAFTNGAVTLRFKLEDPRDSLGLDFADPQCKEVHAGHLLAVRLAAKQVTLQDLKTGAMRLDIQTARQDKQKLTPDQEAALKGKQKVVHHVNEVGKWHDVVVKIQGDELAVSVDGEAIGTLKSPGIGHPTKKQLRLSVPRNAVIDDVKVWRMPADGATD